MSVQVRDNLCLQESLVLTQLGASECQLRRNDGAPVLLRVAGIGTEMSGEWCVSKCLSVPVVSEQGFPACCYKMPY